mmetsp:Transcript_8989/g.23845  ORF Transcript_8989/g.23845 Transcript_8989/m.23845 type:complete len:216 (-) Transcript_8989:333-980(-)
MEERVVVIACSLSAAHPHQLLPEPSHRALERPARCDCGDQRARVQIPAHIADERPHQWRAQNQHGHKPRAARLGNELLMELLGSCQIVHEKGNIVQPQRRLGRHGLVIPRLLNRRCEAAATAGSSSNGAVNVASMDVVHIAYSAVRPPVDEQPAAAQQVHQLPEHLAIDGVAKDDQAQPAMGIQCVEQRRPRIRRRQRKWFPLRCQQRAARLQLA